MEDHKLEWYLESIKAELKKVKDIGFFGSIAFRVNIKDGNISNMNIELSKSVMKK